MVVYMRDQTIGEKKDRKDEASWYVMCHMNPSWIEAMLQKDSSGMLLKEGDKPLPPYRFYVPYLYMPHIAVEKQTDKKYDDKSYDPMDDGNGLRDDLHNFVFIQASAERVNAIVKSEWNVKSRLRMYHYRDTEGRFVTIPDMDMRRFIRTLQNHHLNFFLDQPIGDYAVGDKVILQMEPWVGKVAEVKEVKVRKDRVSMTVALNIFNRMTSINFPDIGFGDVKFVDEEKGRLLSGNPITNYEEEIIDLLSHRFSHKHSDEVAESDRLRLKRLSAYSHIYVEDADDQARFTALKLICAYLRTDRSRKERYTQEVMALLGLENGQHSSVTDETQEGLQALSFTAAYLMTALFITTRNPRYRDAVKDYRHSHPECPDILRRFHSIVKGLKPRKPVRNDKRKKQ